MGFLEKINKRVSSRISCSRFLAARACLPRLNGLDEAMLSLISPDTIYTSANNDISNDLVAVALEAAGRAVRMDMVSVSDRIKSGPRWPDIWPGEHYRFLAGLIDYLQPSTVVEIGTFLGLSALAIKKYLPAHGKLLTFDIIPWHSLPETCLMESDFMDGRLKQELGDLADAAVFDSHRSLFSRADIIFLDGPKDRIFERTFLERLGTVKFEVPSLLVIDDIRLWSMLDIWKEIKLPKLDVTSLGHFSGTGLVRLK